MEFKNLTDAQIKALRDFRIAIENAKEQCQIALRELAELKNQSQTSMDIIETELKLAINELKGGANGKI